VKLIDFADCTIAPGFIDIHIHGSAGFHVMAGDQNGRFRVERFFGQPRVTTDCPTTIGAPRGTPPAAPERLADAIERVQANGTGGARPLGIHLEGPFLSHAKRGVHKAEDLIVPNLRTFEQLWQAARGHVRVLTIAPELDGAPEVITEAAR